MNTQQETNYNELVNPTYTTGQATLEMLAASGNPDAITYKELLSVAGATEKAGRTSNDASQIFTPEEGRALMMGITLSIEARYAAVSRLLKHMCAGEAYAVPRLGEKDTLEPATAEGLWLQWRELLQTSRIELFYLG